MPVANKEVFPESEFISCTRYGAVLPVPAGAHA